MNTFSYRNAMRMDISQMPVNHFEGPSIGSGIFSMIIALLLAALPTMGLVRMFKNGETISLGALIVVFAFFVLSLMIFLFGVELMTEKIEIKIDRDKIEYSSSSILRQNAWSEKLTNYLGIGRRTEYHRGGKKAPSYTLYIIEMLHQDKDKTIWLYKSRSDARFREIWEDCCRRLNMRGLEGDGEAVIFRDVEDFDKSVVEVAAEGKVEVQFDPSARPPSGLMVKAEEEGLKIVQRKKPASNLRTGIWLIIAIALIYSGFSPYNGMLIFFGLAVAMSAAWGAYWSRAAEMVIFVSDEEVKFHYHTPRGSSPEVSVPVSEIETIRIGKKDDNSGFVGVLLITDLQTHVLGMGMSRSELEWLKNCILAVITRKAKT